MTYPIVALALGLVLLVWSADRFVEGAANAAGHFGMSPLLIGMLILGFGTSAPEIVISTLSSIEGKSNLALGNAFGSNIANISLILGVTALISPIFVHSKVLVKELPILAGITFISIFQMRDNAISRVEAVVLLVLFLCFMGWSVWEGKRSKADDLIGEVEEELKAHQMSVKLAVFWLLAGLAVLVASSRMLVWGAVEIATLFGVSELVIGLTIVAIGTSLPELASSVAAARKGEHDLALGNVIGSNMFNTLAVVGIAGVIHPVTVIEEVFSRDMVVMGGLTLSLFVLGYGFKGHGRINRIDGSLLLGVFVSYTIYLLYSVGA